MAPRAGGRHCAACDRVVANLSALTEREAVARYRASGGDLCGYVVHDGRGEPIFAPEPRTRLALGVLVAGALAACEPAAPPRRSEMTASTSVAPLAPLMRPMSADAEPGPDVPAAVAPRTELTALTALEEPAVRESPPTPEDRARERRKRAARRPRVRAHAVFAGRIALDD